MGNRSKVLPQGDDYTGDRPVRGAFGRSKKRVSPIDARIARLGKKELELRRRMLNYVRDGDLTRDEMVEALQ